MPKILVIDDSELICVAVKDVLTQDKTEIISANTAKEGIEQAQKWQPDLILLDILLPDMDGYNTCVVLKKLKDTKDIPVVFITGHEGVDNIVKGFEVGAVDYINKPFHATELKARTYAHLKNKLMADKMRTLNKSLSEASEENRRLASEDSLTGLYNRRYGMEYMEKYQEMLEKEPSSILMGDVDNFKKINDCYGHHMGDYVLCQIADILKEEAGQGNLVCRWGGEEVLLMLHNCGAEDAVERGWAICRRVNQHLFSYEEQDLHCTITFGVSVYNPNEPVEHAINFADQALYSGKNTGKNCCVLYDATIE